MPKQRYTGDSTGDHSRNIQYNMKLRHFGAGLFHEAVQVHRYLFRYGSRKSNIIQSQIEGLLLLTNLKHNLRDAFNARFFGWIIGGPKRVLFETLLFCGLTLLVRLAGLPCRIVSI